MPAARNREQGRRQANLLVARFNGHADHYRSDAFTESDTRNQFIDPLLAALGWDVRDEQGLGPGAEVRLENQHRADVELAGDGSWDEDLTESQLAERAPRRLQPDYVIRHDGRDQFPVEAKKAHVSIRSRHAAFQAKSYAWSRSLPIAVLTNFAELRVFDGRYRPVESRPDANVVPGFDLSYEQYLGSWDLLWGLLSKEAVLGGSLSQYRLTTARVGRAVDKAFLVELDAWRVDVASALYDHNDGLTPQELAEAVQRILDRLVFIRVMEDRGILTEIVLRRYARTSEPYRHLRGEFRRLNAVFNGQLFHPHFSEDLDVPDGVLTSLIGKMYPPLSPYRFDVLGADLLGSIYERFLGQQIVLGADGAVASEMKPEYRHADGVYYTPRWVVDRIVGQILGPLVDGKTPTAVGNLRIVDPACGSGAFLLGAFEFLVAWHERYYEAHPNDQPARHFPGPDGRRHLTSDAKSDILRRCIYGVDIDPQAVEVSQMNLYLAVLEHEDNQTLTQHGRLFESAYLPSLAGNIRCGNSLLSEEDLPRTLLVDENVDLRRRINPFNWHDERDGLGGVFTSRGGFDAVIGNPPYTRVQALREFRPEEADAYQRKYPTAAEGSFDISSLFIERGLELLRRDGRLAFIVSRQFTETDAGRPVRALLSEGRHVQEIVDFADGFVFEEASAYTMLLTLRKTVGRSYRLTRVSSPPTAEALTAAETAGSPLTAVMPSSTLTAEPWGLEFPAEQTLLQQLQNHRTLAQVYGDVVFQGVVTGADYTFCLEYVAPGAPGRIRVRDRRSRAEFELEMDLLRPVLAGRSDIRRFGAPESHQVLVFPYVRADDASQYQRITRAALEAEYPNACRWLDDHEADLRGRSGAWTDDNWWGYSRRQNLELFEAPKVLIPYMLDRLCAVYDTERHFFVNVATGGYGIPAEGADAVYLCAVLNSRLLSWVLRRYSRAFRGGWFAARKGNLIRLPIAEPDEPTRATITDLYRDCVNILASLESARSDHDRDIQQRAYRAATNRFDDAVEAAYGIDDQARHLLATGYGGESGGGEG